MRNELLTGVIPGIPTERTVSHTNYGKLSGDQKVNLAINEVLAMDKASVSKVNVDGGVSLFFGQLDHRAPEWALQQLEAQRAQDTVVSKPDTFWKRNRRKVAHGAVAAAAAVTTALPFFSGAPVAEAAEPSTPIGKNECKPVPAGSMVIGDLRIGSPTGEAMFLYPQTGNFQNRTKMNESAVVCGTEKSAGKFQPNPDAEWIAEQDRILPTRGCQEDKGCDGVRNWSFPNNMPNGAREGCVNDTGLTSGEAISEAVRDWLICRTEGQEKKVRVAEWCRILGDGAIEINGRIVWVNDGDKNTGQIAFIHTTEPAFWVSQYEADVECVGTPLTMEIADARAEKNINDMKAQNMSGVNVVHVMPGGIVNASRR
jgi:hypothetical protein